jgi:hypothetical protein
MLVNPAPAQQSNTRTEHNHTRNGAAQEHRGTHSIYAMHGQLGMGVLAGSRTHRHSTLLIDLAGHAKGLPASALHSSGAAVTCCHSG